MFTASVELPMHGKLASAFDPKVEYPNKVDLKDKKIQKRKTADPGFETYVSSDENKLI